MERCAKHSWGLRNETVSDREGEKLRSLPLLGNDAVESLTEPGGSLLLGNTVRSTNAMSALLSAGDTGTGTGHANVEVGAEDTDRGVVL